MSKIDVQVGDKVRIDGVVSRVTAGNFYLQGITGCEDESPALSSKRITEVLESPIRVGSVVAYKVARGYDTRGQYKVTHMTKFSKVLVEAVSCPRDTFLVDLDRLERVL